MKKIFKEFYEYSDSELEEIWKNAIFIFDTSILNGLYRIPESSRKDFIKILESLKGRIWIPYHVLYEFHKNRRSVIIGLENDYKEATHAMEGLIAELPKKVESKLKSACDKHPLLKFDEIYKEAEKSLKSITKKIEKIKSEKHPDWKNNDKILKKIEKIFSNFGEEYSEEELNEIYKEGEKRYKEKIPPGYSDCKNNGGKKEGNDRFGDLIIWKQILDYAKKTDKPIIFVTDDQKEDWWTKEYNKHVRPRFELKKEFFQISEYSFDIYDLDMFLEKSKKYLNSKITDKSIDEIKIIRKLEEERRLIGKRRLMDSEIELSSRRFEKYLMEYIHILVSLENLVIEIDDAEIHSKFAGRLEGVLHEIRNLKSKIINGEINRATFDEPYEGAKYISFILKELIHSRHIHPKISARIGRNIERLNHLNHRLRRYSR